MPDEVKVTCVVCRNEIEGEVAVELVLHFDGKDFPTCCGACTHELAADPAAFAGPAR